MTYCSPTSRPKARKPLANVTFGDTATLARTDPRATVTTRSKAFSFARARFPETRTTSSKAR